MEEHRKHLACLNHLSLFPLNFTTYPSHVFYQHSISYTMVNSKYIVSSCKAITLPTYRFDQAVAQSTLYRIPLEIRHMIFAYVLPVGTLVRVLGRTDFTPGHYKLMYSNTCARCRHVAAEAQSRHHDGFLKVDTAIFFACHLLHDEALRFLLDVNNIQINNKQIPYFRVSTLTPVRQRLHGNLRLGFGQYTENIRMLTLCGVFLSQKAIPENTLADLRGFVVSFHNLRSLIVFAQLYKFPDSLNHKAKMLLNWFRPLSRLSLREAKVYIRPLTCKHYDGMENSVRQELIDLAEVLLMKDPNDPEEAQVLAVQHQKQANAVQNSQGIAHAWNFVYSSGWYSTGEEVLETTLTKYVDASSKARKKRRGNGSDRWSF